jgi:hypothetical protein
MNTTACITRPYEVLPPRPRRGYKPNQTQFLKILDNSSSKFQRRKPTILRPDVSARRGLVCKKFML